MTETVISLPDVLRLSPSCIRILAGNPGPFTLQGTNTYLLGTGPRRILIDTGEGLIAWKKRLQSTLESERAAVEIALITHRHLDHVGGADHLLELCPHARIHKWNRLSGDGQLDIMDGQQFAVPGATLTALHTPGHTADHTVFIMQEDDAAFTGDCVLGHGTSKFEDLSSYLESLSRMQGRFAGCVYPGHGPIVPDGQAKISEYIAHRQMRERQVVETLDSRETAQGWTTMTLVKSIYHDLPDYLQNAARSGVLQILHKLEEDGIVKGDRSDRDACWRLVEGSS